VLVWTEGKPRSSNNSEEKPRSNPVATIQTTNIKLCTRKSLQPRVSAEKFPRGGGSTGKKDQNIAEKTENSTI